MTLKVAELHHCAVRIPAGPDAAGAALRFYNDVIGLESDHVPWDRAGEDQRINAGSHAQVHLVPGAARNALATGELDLASPHLAFAVMSIEEAQAELDRLAVPYRVVHGRLGPDSRRVFLADPAGNLIELHQLGTCRCTARAREGIGQARVSGTVLFADMRGFTAVAERLSPSDVVPLLNEYFSMLSAITREHGGHGLSHGGRRPDGGLRAAAARGRRQRPGGFRRPRHDFRVRQARGRLENAPRHRDRDRHRDQCRRRDRRRRGRTRTARATR